MMKKEMVEEKEDWSVKVDKMEEKEVRIEEKIEEKIR